MSHINITNCIVRYEDKNRSINEKVTCDNINATLKNHGYDYVRAMFTNSFSYFGNKTPQLRIIIDGSKAGWTGSHTRKFILVKHENIDKDKLHHLNEAGKEVVAWKWEDEKEKIERREAREDGLREGVLALNAYILQNKVKEGSEQYDNLKIAISELERHIY
jgi:hypothetical protein